MISMYYDKFSTVYDIFSPKSYYHKARLEAVKRLQLKAGDVILNVPVGTGQNFEYFQHYLRNTGKVIGIDNSQGMLDKAQQKISKNNWNHIQLINQDVSKLNHDFLTQQNIPKIDAILCDLGLSGFPEWKKIIDNLIDTLGRAGRLSVMD